MTCSSTAIRSDAPRVLIWFLSVSLHVACVTQPQASATGTTAPKASQKATTPSKRAKSAGNLATSQGPPPHRKWTRVLPNPSQPEAIALYRSVIYVAMANGSFYALGTDGSTQVPPAGRLVRASCLQANEGDLFWVSQSERSHLCGCAANDSLCGSEGTLAPVMCDNGALMRVARGERLANALIERVTPLCMTVDSQYAYWTDHHGGLWRITRDGAAQTRLAAGGQTPVGSVAQDTQSVYWSTQEPGAELGRVLSVPKQGGRIRVLREHARLPRVLGVAAHSLLWTEAAKLYARTGNEVREHSTLSAVCMAASGESVILGGPQGLLVWTAGDYRILDGTIHPTSVATDGTTAYWVSSAYVGATTIGALRGR